MKRVTAQIDREYGPFPGINDVYGVSFDGEQIWFAADNGLNALDPESGGVTGTLHVPAAAGTAFDGTHLYQIAQGAIRKIDPRSGEVLATIPAPVDDDNAGLAWAEGYLWLGRHRGRTIHQLDAETGELLRTIESDRFVTGVTWIMDELWHGTWQGEQSEIRRIDAQTGEVIVCLDMPAGEGVSGLESNGSDLLYCGGGTSGTIRAVRLPEQSATLPE